MAPSLHVGDSEAGKGGPSLTMMPLKLTHAQALELYLDAALLGVEDSVMLHRLADAAFRSGQHGLARQALERGLARSPGHVPMLSKLMLVRGAYSPP